MNVSAPLSTPARFTHFLERLSLKRLSVETRLAASPCAEETRQAPRNLQEISLRRLLDFVARWD